jgi:hypothetical protein
MTKALTIAALLFQFTIPQRGTIATAPVSCTTPTQLTDVWLVFNAFPLVTCDSGVTCVTGVNVNNDLVTDTITSANNATQSTNSQRPIWTANVVGTHAGDAFSGGSLQLLSYTGSTYSNVVIGVLAHTVPSLGTVDAFFGGSSNGALELKINASGKLELDVQEQALIGQGSTIYTPGATLNFMATFSGSTWALYSMSGGTATLDASGSYSGTALSNANNQLGAATGVPEFGIGTYLGWFAGTGTTSITNIATWATCETSI